MQITFSKYKLIALFVALGLLQGCAAVVVGAGLGAASVAHDRRTVGTQLDDKTLAGKVIARLAKNKALEEGANINVLVFNGVLLLTGQAPTESLRAEAHKIAAAVPHIKKTHNLIRIGHPIAPSTAAHDVWLASKVRAQLLTDKRIDGLHISITVEDSEVFLMGLVKSNEANVAVDIVRNINGVTQVVKAFEYL
ncbi:BON domain-containing protein [Aestuariibacter sp. AA17]|uniref:BON domain-containing protein n=1 Tax=Fluctibacter corallii TaxID=2984329 RepID=A0ABT3A4B0_9ALTE|nr:BON domain-containing protein [Aestuariibacter sp. AA17]MCV2883527.1 BON domain-containing protein [Aestuariibacter sp. AA17]